MMSRLTLLAVSLMVTTIASAGTSVRVQYNGSVDFNIIPTAVSPLSAVAAGAPTTISFLVDSDVFLDNPNFPTRSYEIASESFTMTLGDFEIGLEDPYQGGFIAPSFILRNDDPAVDGFFLSDNANFPDPISTNQAGGNGPFGVHASVTYDSNPLTSLDILDAQGSYDFTGLTAFGWTMTDGPFDAMGFVFEDMTISTVPEPSPIVLGSLGFLISLGWCRNRRCYLRDLGL